MVFIMSFSVQLYTFSKRDNSTAKPTGTGTTYNCILKSGSGILRPTLSFDLGLSSDPSSFNYAYISAFGRYYFIEEWFFEDRLWTATLKVDVLATYKTQIGNSYLYVLRAASEQNGNIVDNLYPALSICDFESVTKTNPWDAASGCYVVGIVSKNASFGSLNYYAMSAADLSSLCAFLLDNTVTTNNGFSWDDCSQALQLSLVDPMQYIKSCVYLPVDISDVVGASAIVYVFNWNTGITAKKLYQMPYVHKSYTFTMKRHPLTNTYGDYVNLSPFTNITLTFPPFGCFDIDTTVANNSNGVGVSIYLDPITGKASMTVDAAGIVINRVEAQLGVPITLSSVSRDYVGAVSSVAGAVGGAVAGASIAGVGGAVLGAVNGIGNAVSALVPRASTIGTTGSFATLEGTPRLDFQFFDIATLDPTHNGYPVCNPKTISNLSGYILVRDGDVATNGTSTEDAAIKNYLETGFYYE